MRQIGDIEMDGRRVGVILVDLTTGTDATYPKGLEFTPMGSRESPSGLGPREGPSGSPYGRDIGPGYRHHDRGRSTGRSDREPEKHGPTFRGKYKPRGEAPPEKPEHYTVEGIRKKLDEGYKGGVDRTAIAKELAGNEALTRRYATMTYREVNPGASDRALTAQAETAANRALKRKHSLEQALWSTRDHGKYGYYPQITYDRGLTEVEYEHFRTKILPEVLAGSDVVRGMTGNASLGVAARQKARGTPYTEEFRAEGGDTYFDEDVGKTFSRLPGKPVGVTRLPGDPNYRGAAPEVSERGGQTPAGQIPWPVEGILHQGPGAARPGHIHQGVDVFAPPGMPARGMPIHAMGPGTVTGAHWSHSPTGGFVMVNYDNGLQGRYIHLGTWDQHKVGERVNAGDVIGTMGDPPGTTHMPHLHYELRDKQGRVLDPAVVHGTGHFGPRGEGLQGTHVYSRPHDPWHWAPAKVNPVEPAIPSHQGAIDQVFPRYASAEAGSDYGQPVSGRSLADERARFGVELRKPEVQSRLLHLIQTENPQNPHAFVENVMNRASARNTSLLAQMNNPNYYPPVSIIGARSEDPARSLQAIHAALGGSNLTNFATGNASGKVGFGYGQGAKDPYTYKDLKSGERYGIENRQSDIDWARRMSTFDQSQE